MHSLRIDCAECVMQGTSACDDCIVTHLLDRGGPVLLDRDESSAVATLQEYGLAPASRFLPVPR